MASQKASPPGCSTGALRSHAVLVPWPGQGHINPLMHLSRRLALHGFSITFVNIDYTHRRLASSIRRFEQDAVEQAKLHIGAASKLDITFVTLPDGISVDDTHTGDVPELCRGLLRSSAAFERLLEEFQPPPTCIISDMFALHTQDAANKFGIPRVCFWTQSAASYAAHIAAAKGLIEYIPPGPDSTDKNIITNLAGAPAALRAQDLPSFLRRDDPFIFDICIQPFLRTSEALCVLMNTFDDLEGNAMEQLRQQQPDCTFYTIGPTLPLDYFTGGKLSRSMMNKSLGFWLEDYACVEWLDKQEEGSVLYVSFGSITQLSGEAIEEFAWGLEVSGFRVLWVLRPGILEDAGTAATVLPCGFEEKMEGRLMIVEWAPQLHVLAHPAIGGFLTHAGWNSILEGVAQGKPMLGFPYFGDQMLNCRCMEEVWGNGLAFERHGLGGLTRALVASKVRAAMADAIKLRECALQLRDAARRAVVSDSGTSSANFRSFLTTVQ